MSLSNKIKVLIAQPEVEGRAHLRRKLTGVSDLVIVSEVDRGEAVLDACLDHAVDVVVMDLLLPGLDGLTVTQLLRARFPKVHVLIVTDVEDTDLASIALRAGATGYLRQDIAGQFLIDAVRAVARGLVTLVEQDIAALVSQQPTYNLSSLWIDASTINLTDKTQANALESYWSLTNRECQILNLVLMGYTSAEIGKKLYISPRTAEKHRANLMKKLEVHNQHELARFAYSIGLMPFEELESHTSAKSPAQQSKLLRLQRLPEEASSA